MEPISTKSILALSVPERLRLIQAVWDSILDAPESLPVSDFEREILDQRLEAFRKDPQAGAPWRDVLRRNTSVISWMIPPKPLS